MTVGGSHRCIELSLGLMYTSGKLPRVSKSPKHAKTCQEKGDRIGISARRRPWTSCILSAPNNSIVVWRVISMRSPPQHAFSVRHAGRRSPANDLSVGVAVRSAVFSPLIILLSKQKETTVIRDRAAPGVRSWRARPNRMRARVLSAEHNITFAVGLDVLAGS
jgi:hypothetical protein